MVSACESLDQQMIQNAFNGCCREHTVHTGLRWLDTVLKKLSCSLLDIHIFGTGKFQLYKGCKPDGIIGVI